jgi:DHA2 family multidrug resistance protein-like MFS transporter
MIPADEDRMTGGLPLRRRTWAALALATGLLVTILDASMVIVMLPVIASTFEVEPSVAIWAMTAYQLTFSSLILPFAALGEKYGHWRVYCTGIAMFAVGAIFSGLSTSLAALLVGRILQGIGAAGAHGMTMALLRHSYPPHLFGRAAGVNASVVGMSMAAGPTAAAAILMIADWRAMFLITLPVALFSAVTGFFALPRVSRRNMRFDLPSALLTAGCILLLVLGLNEARADSNPVALWILVGSSAVLLLLLILRLRGSTDPVLPLDLLTHKIIALSLFSLLCMFLAQAAVMISLPFKLGGLLDLPAGAIGMLLTPWPVGVGLVASSAGRLADRYSARGLCGIGAAMLCCGTFLLLFLPSSPAPIDILWRVAVCGVGFGLFSTPNNRIIMLNAPLTRASASGGLMATTRLLGQTFGATFAAIGFSYWPEDGGNAAIGLAAAAALGALTITLVRKAE